ncbi:MAG: hypothetical protein ACP5MI_11835, partial [Candidatus Kryptoniota bacterium]
DIKSFIDESVKLVPGMIKTVRIDSVGYNHFVFDYCFDNNLNFTITADHDMAVMDNSLPTVYTLQLAYLLLILFNFSSSIISAITGAQRH